MFRPVFGWVWGHVWDLFHTAAERGREPGHLEDVSRFLKHSSCEDEHRPTATHSWKREKEKEGSFWICYCLNCESISTGTNSWQRVCGWENCPAINLALSHAWSFFHSPLFYLYPNFMASLEATIPKDTLTSGPHTKLRCTTVSLRGLLCNFWNLQFGWGLPAAWNSYRVDGHGIHIYLLPESHELMEINMK